VTLPIAAFLAGALLTLLLPIGLLISLTVWYLKYVLGRVPGPEATSGTEAPATAPGADEVKR
jgi:hypothetical protein